MHEDPDSMPPNPFDNMPQEILYDILTLSNPSPQDLKKIPAICRSLEESRMSLLNRLKQQLKITHPSELDSYINTLNYLPKILNLHLSFIPNKEQLRRLSKNEVTLFIPPPVRETKVEEAFKLLNYQHVYLDFQQFDWPLPGWTIEELKQLWNRLEESDSFNREGMVDACMGTTMSDRLEVGFYRRLNPPPTPRIRLMKSLDFYEYTYCDSLDLLKHAIAQYPFLTRLKVLNVKGQFSYLADFIQHNNTVTSLNLEKAFLRGDGLKTIVPALKKNKTLTSLNLKLGVIGPKGRSLRLGAEIRVLHFC